MACVPRPRIAAMIVVAASATSRSARMTPLCGRAPGRWPASRARRRRSRAAARRSTGRAGRAPAARHRRRTLDPGGAAPASTNSQRMTASASRGASRIVGGRRLAELIDEAGADGANQGVLAVEVVQQGAVVDAGGAGDVGEAQALEAAFGDEAIGDAGRFRRGGRGAAVRHAGQRSIPLVQPDS